MEDWPVLGEEGRGSLSWCWCLAEELEAVLCFLLGSWGVVTNLLLNCLSTSAKFDILARITRYLFTKSTYPQ